MRFSRHISLHGAHFAPKAKQSAGKSVMTFFLAPLLLKFGKNQFLAVEQILIIVIYNGRKLKWTNVNSEKMQQI